MTNHKKLIEQFNKMINMECKEIEVYQGFLLPLITLGFGEIVESYTDPKTGIISLSREYSFYFGSYDNEFVLWRVNDKNRIIASSAIINQRKDIIKLFNKNITCILGKKLLNYKYNPKTNDLTLIFENNYSVNLINIIAKSISKYKYYDDTEICHLSFPGNYFTLYADCKNLHDFRVKKKYITDYEEHPEKYSF
jgi:hypothetical protein